MEVGRARKALGPGAFIYPDVARRGLLTTQIVLVEESSQLRLEPLQWLEMPMQKHHHIHH